MIIFYPRSFAKLIFNDLETVVLHTKATNTSRDRRCGPCGVAFRAPQCTMRHGKAGAHECPFSFDILVHVACRFVHMCTHSVVQSIVDVPVKSNTINYSLNKWFFAKTISKDRYQALASPKIRPFDGPQDKRLHSQSVSRVVSQNA